MSYNGHKSWAFWNVSLWLSNDEGLYRWVCELLRRHTKDEAATILSVALDKTPDGARYSRSAVRAALAGWS